MGLFDASGDAVQDTSIDVDDFGNPLPQHIETAQCSSLSRSTHSNCPQLTNDPSFGAALVLLDNNYLPSRYTQSRFAALRSTVEINDDLSIDDMTYFRQTDNDFATKTLQKPIEFDKQIEKAKTKLEKQKIENNKKYGKDPNLLLNFNKKNTNKNNGKQTDIFSRFAKDINSNNIFTQNQANTNTNGDNNINTQIKTYRLDANGRLTEEEYPINSNNNGNSNNNPNTNENGDNIASVMDAAVTQLVTNMLS